jgi:phosphate-selective porin OprO and OprP
VTVPKRLEVLPRITSIVMMLIGFTLQGQTVVLPEDAADSSPPPAISAMRAVSFGHDGLLLSSEDSSIQLRAHGFFQADGRFFSSDLKDQSPDKLFFRRIRPIFEGTLFKTLSFHFMPDFGQNNPQIQDVYLELKLFSFLKPRVGKFKTPLGLEDLRSDSESSFSERSLASDLVPLRELGAQISGGMLRETIRYAAGYFNGTTDGSNGNFQWRTSNEGVVRIFLQPFLTGRAKPLRGLGMGASGSVADERGTLPNFKTVGQDTFFKYSSKAIADGQHNRVSPQAWYYWGPVGLIGEYTISSQQVRNQASARRLNNQVWQATASFMLTGEKNSYEGVRPQQAFEPQKGIRHLGGWELAVRCSRLQVDGNAFPLFADPKKAAAGAAEWGVALNWYLNRFARIMNAYEHTSFGMASPQPAPFHSENVVMSRLQLAF